MNTGLEKIVTGLKQVGRKTLNFINENAKTGLMLGATLGAGFVADKMMNKAEGVEINLCNIAYTPDNIGYNYLVIKTQEGYSEGFTHSPEDSEFTDISSPGLEIYSMPSGTKADIDGRPLNTSGVNFTLSGVGEYNTSLPFDNVVWAWFENTSGLDHKRVLVQAGSDPNFYEVPKDNPLGRELYILTTTTLPSGPYATGAIRIVPNVRGDIAGPNGNSPDGQNDLYDLMAFSRDYLGEPNSVSRLTGDVDGNGVVDLTDYAEVAGGYGQSESGPISKANPIPSKFIPQLTPTIDGAIDSVYSGQNALQSKYLAGFRNDAMKRFYGSEKDSLETRTADIAT